MKEGVVGLWWYIWKFPITENVQIMPANAVGQASSEMVIIRIRVRTQCEILANYNHSQHYTFFFLKYQFSRIECHEKLDIQNVINELIFKTVIRTFNRCVKLLNDFVQELPHFWVLHKFISKHSMGDQYNFVHTIVASIPIQR